MSISGCKIYLLSSEKMDRSELFRMGDYRDFTYIWFADSHLNQVECPHCGAKESYRKEEVTRSGHVRCKKCGSLFKISS